MKKYKRYRRTSPLEIVSTKIEATTLIKIERIANKAKTTKSALIRDAIEKFLEDAA